MSNPQQILATDRLILRELSPPDLDALSLVLSDRETMRFYLAPFDEYGVKEWINLNLRRYAKDGHGLWAVVEKDSGQLIGDCGLTVQEVDGDEEVEIGYHIRRDRWRQGFATEAARACRDYGSSRLRIQRLIALIRPENLASRRVAEKIGLKPWKETLHSGLQHLVYSIPREA